MATSKSGMAITGLTTVMFFDLAFTQRKPTEAALEYISPTTYIQHNPEGKDGRDTFINGLAKYVEKGNLRCTIKRTIAEGNLVAIHNHCIDKVVSILKRNTAIIY